MSSTPSTPDRTSGSSRPNHITSRQPSTPTPGSRSFRAMFSPSRTPTPGEKATRPPVLSRTFSTPTPETYSQRPQYINNPPTTPTPASTSAHSPVLNSPTSPLSPPTRTLDVVKKRTGHGRVIFCKARNSHKSQTLDYFAGRQVKPRMISEMKRKLLWVLKPEQATTADYLATAAGNMLERIIEWDRDQAGILEQEDVPILSSIPKAENINEIDARYIVERFRRAMLSLPGEDYRSAYGRLPEEPLLGLLHYTFLIARPVLAWELDLDGS